MNAISDEGLKLSTAFTIGNKSSYDRAVVEGATKLGRSADYDGGCVWPTRGEAEAYLAPTGGMVSFEDKPPVRCAVYRLVLPHGWEQDVDSTRFSDEGFHRLVNDAPIFLPDVRLVACPWCDGTPAGCDDCKHQGYVPECGMCGCPLLHNGRWVCTSSTPHSV